MAWIDPSAVAQGEVLTSAKWNQDVVENLSVLRALANVKSTTVNTVQSTTSTSLVDITGMGVSITPTSSTSKVLVSCHIQVGDSSADDIPFRVMRGSTPIGIGGLEGASNVSFYLRADAQSGPDLQIWSLSWEYLDEPNTTSATTYKLQWSVRIAGQKAYLNRRGYEAYYVTASTITAREIPV